MKTNRLEPGETFERRRERRPLVRHRGSKYEKAFETNWKINVFFRIKRFSNVK